MSKGGKIQNTKLRIEHSTFFGQWKLYQYFSEDIRPLAETEVFSNIKPRYQNRSADNLVPKKLPSNFFINMFIPCELLCQGKLDPSFFVATPFLRMVSLIHLPIWYQERVIVSLPL